MLLNNVKILVVSILVQAVLLASATMAFAQAKSEDMLTISPNDNISESMDEPISYSSIEGKFDIVFPAGCPQIYSRSPGDPGDDIPYVYVYCDRFKTKGEGYSISTWFDAKGPHGGLPGIDELKAKMDESITKLGVVVVKQVPISVESPSGLKMEGIDLLTRTKDSVGQAWLRGWVFEGRLYLITAWRSTGDLLEQAGLKEFFNSFQPG